MNENYEKNIPRHQDTSNVSWMSPRKDAGKLGAKDILSPLYAAFFALCRHRQLVVINLVPK
jgi:hypothetical protein